MAQKLHVVLMDDLDGSHADETVRFGLDGRTYEIDLNKRNATRLRRALEPFIDAGRAASGRRPKGTPPEDPARGHGYDLADLRAWAKRNGIEVPARGRIRRTVIEQYQAAVEQR